MKRVVLAASGLFLASLVLPACSSKKTLDVAKLPCKERTPTSGSNGAYIQCTAPTEDIDVGAGMVCKKGATLGIYTASKTVYECWVKTPVTLGGVTCTGGVQLYPDAKLRRCQLDAELSQKGLKLPKGSWITWTQAGDLRRLELPTPTAVGPYKCKGFMNFVFPDGKPNRCELAEPATVENQPKKAGEVLCFDDAGKVADCSKFVFGAL